MKQYCLTFASLSTKATSEMNIKENCTVLAGFKDDVENIKPHQENAVI